MNKPVWRNPSPAAVLTGIRSDSHTWNLVFMQLWLEEQGFRVTNLGSCVPVDDVIAACERHRPALLVVSTVNGHGSIEGQAMVRELQRARALNDTRIVIGGKLATSLAREAQAVGELQAAGFDRTLTGPDALEDFAGYLETLQPAAGVAQRVAMA